MADQNLEPKPVLISRIQVRRGTTIQWTIANPILKEGEIGFDIVLNKIKIGDGVRHYLDLPFIAEQRYSDDFEIIEEVVHLYKTPAITLTGGTIREVGEIVATVYLAWTLSKEAISRIFTSGPLLGLDLGDGGSGTYIHSNANLTSDTTYTLTVDDSRRVAGSSTTVRFTHRCYWGVNPNPTLNDTDILNLQSELAFDRNKAWTQNGAGQYIYFCYPSSWGVATFTVNGLINTAWTLTTQNHINQWGVATPYRIYRTNDIQFGNSISINCG